VAKKNEVGMTTYLVTRKGGQDQKITVPSHWRVTFGPLNPGSKNIAANGAPALRFYEAENKQRAVITEVISFRDMSIRVEEKRTNIKREVLSKDTHGGKKDVIVEGRVEEWVNPDKPIETGADSASNIMPTRTGSTVSPMNFEFTEDMNEISGLGGAHERALRAGVITGAKWWTLHPEADPEIEGTDREYRGTNADGESLLRAVNETLFTCDDGVKVPLQAVLTPHMYYAVMYHIMWIGEHGWSRYAQAMRAPLQLHDTSTTEGIDESTTS
jgi:hypothetical protein